MTDVVGEVTTMLRDHWFWGILTLACLVWYSTITVYVAVKGVRDIRNMLRTLSSSKKDVQ